MKNKIVNCLTIVFISALSLSAQNQKPTDTELWLGGNLRYKLNKNWSFDGSQQFRYNDTISSLKTALTEFGASYKINKHFSVKGHYRFIIKPNKNDRRRIYFDLGYKWKKKDFPVSFTYRLRYQHTTIHNKLTNYDVIRHKIGMGYNASKLVDPYTAYEIYYRFDGKNEFRRGRFTLGLDWKLKKALSLSTFYRIQSDLNIKKAERQKILGMMISYKMK